MTKRVRRLQQPHRHPIFGHRWLHVPMMKLAEVELRILNSLVSPEPKPEGYVVDSQPEALRYVILQAWLTLTEDRQDEPAVRWVRERLKMRSVPETQTFDHAFIEQLAGWDKGELGYCAQQQMTATTLAEIQEVPSTAPTESLTYEQLPPLATLQQWIDRTEAKEREEAAEAAERELSRTHVLDGFNGLVPRDLSMLDGKGDAGRAERAIDCLRRLKLVTEGEWLMLRARFLRRIRQLPMPVGSTIYEPRFTYEDGESEDSAGVGADAGVLSGIVAQPSQFAGQKAVAEGGGGQTSAVSSS